MQICINDQPHTLRDGATLLDALAAFAAPPPFAVALNEVFIPQSAYPHCRLNSGDRLEVVRPIAGG